MTIGRMAPFLGYLCVINIGVVLATDWFDGKYDPIGPYPRIPDKDRLQKEIEFAEEFKKLTNYKPPKSLFFEGTR